MTAQPTTRITPQFAPQQFAPQQFAPPQFAAQQFAPPQFAPQQFAAEPLAGRPYGPAFPPPFTPPLPTPPLPTSPRRSTGRAVGIVAGVLVLLAGLGLGALLAFGPRTVDPQSVQQEIVRITRTAVQVAPADVRCPEGVEAQAGGTFTCTATVDRQPVTYSVRQDDDRGHLTITYDRLLKIAELEGVVAGQVAHDVGVTVSVDCAAAGRTLLVNAPGTPIACTAANTADPTDTAAISVTVAADGTPAYTFA